MKLVTIPGGEAGKYAPLWWPIIQKAAMAGGVSNEELEQIQNGIMQLHVIVDDAPDTKAVIGTRTYRRGDIQIGEIAVCAGAEMASWIHLLPDLERTMRDLYGAQRIVVEKGRPGWRRALAQYGYHTTRVCFERKLT
jgi:hypothetical protein